MADTELVCYRHPNREVGVICQRCDRGICPDCATPGAVGFLCPDCAGEKTKVRQYNPNAGMLSRAPITFALIAINVAVYVFQVLDPTLWQSLAYAPQFNGANGLLQVFTSGFTHSQTSIMHILLNMYSLFLFGTAIEPMIGKARFAALYFIAMLGGGLGVLVLAPDSVVVGASGAIFGLMGAYLILLRAVGGNASQMYAVIAINLVFGFIQPGIAWQAHVGGLIAGIVVAYIYAQTRKKEQLMIQIVAVAGFAVVLLAAWAVIAPTVAI